MRRSDRGWRPYVLAAMTALGCAAWPALAATTASTAEPHPPAPASDSHLYGMYLAGRHAERLRDYPAASSWFDKAIVADPAAPELISRTFMMAVGAGNFDRARALSH